MEKPTLTVTQLNRYVRSLLEENATLRNVFVKGEISNLKSHYASGHLYFSLKDDGGLIRSVMFRSSAARLSWQPENGMQVICAGRVSLYDKDGSYQLYVNDMQPDGLGALTLARDQLKKKLAAEGLFDVQRKRPLPRYPRQIAVVTSKTGAAVRDILSILERRWPWTEVLLCPVSVQGELAVPEITDTMARLARLGTPDLIILGRGGGSVEDLSAFDQEPLVRAVAASPIPVISAVGHETDFTLCDLAADLRAPTPSAAAELAVPDRQDYQRSLTGCRQRLVAAATGCYAREHRRLLALKNHRALSSPVYRIEQTMLQLDGLSSRMQAVLQRRLTMWEGQLHRAAAGLDALSPLQVLSRGYALPMKGNKPVVSVEQVAPGDLLLLRMSDGTLDCTVNLVNSEINPEESEEPVNE